MSALLVIAQIHDLPSKSVDFVLAFLRADLKETVYMEIPAGMALAEGNRKNKGFKAA